MPQNRWLRIHFYHAINFVGLNWLLVIDYYSKYICIHRTSDISTFSTMRFLNEDFQPFEYYEEIVSDNGRSCVSHEFNSMCVDKNIKHVATSAYHPSTNGLWRVFYKGSNEKCKNLILISIILLMIFLLCTDERFFNLDYLPVSY